MRIRKLVLAAFAVAIAGCGSGEADLSSPAAKETADGLPIVPSLANPQDPISDPSPAGLGPEPKRYIIYWEKDPYLSGYYDFVVHPTQVFLRSSLKYSSSNAVLWVADISPDQYRAIGDSLDRHMNESFAPGSDRTHEGYTLFLFKSAEEVPQFTNSTTAESWQKIFDKIMNRNLQNIVGELNRHLPHEVEPLVSQASMPPRERRLTILEDPRSRVASPDDSGRGR